MSICRKETKNLHTAFHLYKHCNPTNRPHGKNQKKKQIQCLFISQTSRGLSMHFNRSLPSIKPKKSNLPHEVQVAACAKENRRTTSLTGNYLGQ